GPRLRRTLETHPKPRQRADLQAQAAVYSCDAASRRRRSGGAFPETLEQKDRLIYLSVPFRRYSLHRETAARASAEKYHGVRVGPRDRSVCQSPPASRG